MQRPGGHGLPSAPVRRPPRVHLQNDLHGKFQPSYGLGFGYREGGGAGKLPAVGGLGMEALAPAETAAGAGGRGAADGGASAGGGGWAVELAAGRVTQERLRPLAVRSAEPGADVAVAVDGAGGRAGLDDSRHRNGRGQEPRWPLRQPAHR